MVKIIAFDLDDTLLNSNSIISNENIVAIKKCREKGIKIGYITARSHRKIKKFIGELPCDFIANFNGALITIDRKHVIRNEIDYDNGVDVIKKVLRVAPNIEFSAYFEPYAMRHNIINSTINDNLNLQFDANLFNLPRANFQRIRLDLKEYKDIDIAKYTTSDMFYYNTVHNSSIIVNKKANKGNAIKLVCEY